jgi:L-threonylcarbamoyladenylate synthase
MVAEPAHITAADPACEQILGRVGRRFWPGPLTLVVLVQGRWLGYRVPDHSVALALLRAVGEPLAVTSANRSGEPPARTGREVIAALGDAVDLVLDGGAVPGGVPSTVARIDKGQVELLREGALSESELRSELEP